MPTDAAHWDAVYRGGASDRLGWHQPSPRTSLRLVEAIGVPPDAPIVDVGAGTSHLADELVARGHTDLTLVDVARSALDAVCARIGDLPTVTRVVADVTTWSPPRQYAIWHDRAVLHFLVDDAELERYLRVARTAVRPGGHAVIGTFAPSGPETCSGLPVRRYGAAELEAAFADAFTLVHHEEEHHLTPAGAVQPYTWVVLRHH